jgi:hypothetical protein
MVLSTESPYVLHREAQMEPAGDDVYFVPAVADDTGHQRGVNDSVDATYASKLQATLLFLVKLCLTLLCKSLFLLIKTNTTLLMQFLRPIKCTQMSILSNKVSL